MAFNTTIFIFSIVCAFSLALLFEGDDCVMLNATEGGGKCIRLDKCEHANQLLRVHKIPQSCGFKRQNPLVCCPLASMVKSNSTTTKSDEKCQQFHNIRNIDTGIARGEKAKAREFPHMAALGYGDNLTNVMWLCGGTLISKRFVLTAAHCVNTLNFGRPKWVRLGELNLNNTNDDAAPQDITVGEIFTHPDYKPPSHYNDIALLKLKAKVSITSYIRPACLHTKKSLPSGKLQATGWGKIDFFDDISSDHLMKVFLNIIEHERCKKIYSNVSPRKLAHGIVDESQICAGDLSGKDTCPGDSGGPLHFLRKGSSDVVDHFVVVGVTSFGKGCGFENSAGVYTRVSQYRSWIEDIVWRVR